jgi:hypothetical protein
MSNSNIVTEVIIREDSLQVVDISEIVDNGISKRQFVRATCLVLSIQQSYSSQVNKLGKTLEDFVQDQIPFLRIVPDPGQVYAGLISSLLTADATSSLEVQKASLCKDRRTASSE